MATTVDLEKQDALPRPQPDDDSSVERDSSSAVDIGDAQVGAIRESNGILRFLAGVEKRIDKVTKFEAMGVERVPEDKRQPPQKINVNAPLFLSGCMVLSPCDSTTVPLFFLFGKMCV